MTGFRPRRRYLPLTATPAGHRPSQMRGYNPLYPDQAKPALGIVPGAD
jgi:hypothetical protein